MPSSAACGRQLPPRGKPLELTGAFSLWGRRCPRPRPRTDEGRACGGCPLKGRPRKLCPHQPPAGAVPREKPLELTGAFSPWGRRCPRPRPRTDEGRVCGGCPLKGDHANFALISRLRAAASPEGEAFRTDRSLLPLGEKVSAAPPADG